MQIRLFNFVTENAYTANILKLEIIRSFVSIKIWSRMSDDENQWIKDDYGDEELSQPASLDSSELSQPQSVFSHHPLKQEPSDDEADFQNKAPNSEENSSSDDESEESLRNGDCRVLEPIQPYISTSSRITSNYMTKYEYAQIIGKRAHQISKNSPLYVQIDEKEVKKYDVIEIAEMQLKAGKLPYILRRVLPNGYYEDWKVSELLIMDQL